ncbi:MAG TPA: hypothetical protein VFG68_19575 [Fimbriiglobus sp.]|nr:hypothetical protein [Fimbriiglobus sp.]
MPGHDVDDPLLLIRGHVLDEVHEVDAVLPILGQVFELDVARFRLHHPGAVAVAVEAVAGGEDGLVGALAEFVVVAPQVHPGGEEGFGEGVVEHVAGGATPQLAIGRTGVLGGAADLAGGGAEIAGGGLPRRPLGAQLGRAGEQGVGGVGRRDHDETTAGEGPSRAIGRLVYI